MFCLIPFFTHPAKAKTYMKKRAAVCPPPAPKMVTKL